MKQTTMTTRRTWKTEAGTIRVLPGRCCLLDMTIGGRSSLADFGEAVEIAHAHRDGAIKVLLTL
jgi:hypothetical protein